MLLECGGNANSPAPMPRRSLNFPNGNFGIVDESIHNP
jgi:hypothetical protein